MSFMTEDCVFEASAGPGRFGARYVGREGSEPASLRSGESSPMPAGAMRATSSKASAECRSGRSREHGPMALVWRFMVAICSPFGGGRIALKNSYRKNRPPFGPPKR